MKGNRVKDLDGMREPTEEEIEKIVRYYEHLYSKKMRSANWIGLACVVLCVICLISYKDGDVATLVIAALFVLLAAFMLLGKGGVMPLLRALNAGRFQVCPGTVGKITPNKETPGVKNVTFRTIGGKEAEGVYRARAEQLRTGSPLLLVYAERRAAHHEINRVFTPFMLTEKGLAGSLFG